MNPVRVERHSVYLYGHPNGLAAPSHQHAHIALWDARGANVAAINFIEPGRPLLRDKLESGGRVIMEMPVSMMPTVLDVLRHERSVYVLFRAGQGYLMTGEDLIGLSIPVRGRRSGDAVPLQRVSKN